MAFLDVFKGLPSLKELKGSAGEQLTKYFCKATTDMLVLRDVLIDGANGGTSQIDLLLIGAKGVFVIEVKYYHEHATVYGSGKNSKWYYYLGGKRYELYSPLHQNKQHVKYLKTLLADFGDVPMFSALVIFCKDFKVEHVNADPQNPDTFVCNSLPALQRGIGVISENRPDVLDEEKRSKLRDYIAEHQHGGKEARREHVERVRDVQQKQKMYREQNMCPYCKKELVLRKGKYGSFYGCSNYPKCRYTQKAEEKQSE